MTSNPSQDDLHYEEEIRRNPLSLNIWWRYLIAHANPPSKKRFIMYEHALEALPGSYKLWHAFLSERLVAVRNLPFSHPLFSSLNNTFERALLTMHKMPCIWKMYLQTLTHDQLLLTHSRRTFDRALRALPITQHHLIWPMYIQFVTRPGVPIETALHVHRRYLMFDPSHIEDFIEFLLNSHLWQEAAEHLASALNDDSFHSIKGKTNHQLWLELNDLFNQHATEISKMKVEEVLRGGIRMFNNEVGIVGSLWTLLAEYYVRRGLFEKARDVFEEGLATVETVTDFSVIFDCYVQFEEIAINARMMELDGGNEEDWVGEERDVRLDCNLSVEELGKRILHGLWLNDDDDAHLRIARLEHLVSRRPKLLNSVLLRQNPHNVEHWHRRVQLFEDNPMRHFLTLVEAVRTVDPMKAVGKPHTLWVAFARLYERCDDIEKARRICEEAVRVNYETVDDLATVWCEWAEMEVRHKNSKGALELMRRATKEPSIETKRTVAADGNEPVEMKLHKSLRVWACYANLEASIGTLVSTCEVYERILGLKIASPQIIINYAVFLEKKKYFEDSFTVYERGVEIFKFPHVKVIWITYLSKFVERYGKTKLEQARELFRRAVEMAPAEDVKPLYLQFANFEKDYGLAEHEMKVYDQATMAVLDHEKMNMYEIYIARATEILGIPKVRELYEQALKDGVPDKDLKIMFMRYAELEKSLGEIDRARTIYLSASKFVHPCSNTDFWNEWHAFEAAHGDGNTFKKMQSVAASYSQTDFIGSETWSDTGRKRKLSFISAGVEAETRREATSNEGIKLHEDNGSDGGNDKKRDVSGEADEGNSHFAALERIKRQRRQ